MKQKFRSLNLAMLVTGPGYNTKRGYLEISNALRGASKAIDILSCKWDYDIHEFIESVPRFSGLDPLVLGLTGKTLLLDNTVTSTHPFYWNGDRSLTVFEALEQIKDSNDDIKQIFNRVKSEIARVTKLDVKRRFSLFPDTPTNYFHNQLLRVKADESVLENTDVTPTVDNTFLGLRDTPDEYTGANNYLVTSKLDQSGVEFYNPTTIEPYLFVTQESIDSPTVLPQILRNSLLSVLRDVSSQTIYLPPISDGAEVIFRNENFTAGTTSFSGINGSTVENEPIDLNDTRKFLHLVYDATNSKYIVIGYH